MTTKKITGIIAIIITAAAFFTARCYDPGDAVVTIHIERNDLAAMGITPEPELSLIDRILNFFSTRAEAAPTWNSTKSDLELSITGSGVGIQTFTIPPTATSYTVTIPSGSPATFTITSETDWGPSTGNIQKNWGGHITFDLKPGDQNITIQMMPMTYISNVMQSANIMITWQTTSISTVIPVSSYNIYRSTEIDGEYILRGTATSGTYGDMGTVGTRYYYRVSCVTTYGEGVMCDPKTW